MKYEVTLNFKGRPVRADGIEWEQTHTIVMDDALGPIADDQDILRKHPDFVKLYDAYEWISNVRMVRQEAIQA